MAHFASELDYRRILKNCSKYYLDEDYIRQVYKSGFMVVSDMNLMAFCYPVEYFDGILIRHYNSSRREELMDLVAFTGPRLKGKLFLPHVMGEDTSQFGPLGFKCFYETSGLYKTDYNISPGNYPCTIEDFDLDYFKEMEQIDKTLFPYNWRFSYSDIFGLAADKNVRIRVCRLDKNLLGFIIVRVDKNIGYGYVAKIAVKKEFQRVGIGSMLMTDSISFFKKKGVLPIFTDTVNNAAKSFFESCGFRVYSSTNMLVREE